MSPGRIDVLAAIDEQLKFTAASDYPGADAAHQSLLTARGAVADLIDAARKLRAAHVAVECGATSRKLRRRAQAALVLGLMLDRIGGAA